MKGDQLVISFAVARNSYLKREGFPNHEPLSSLTGISEAVGGFDPSSVYADRREENRYLRERLREGV